MVTILTQPVSLAEIQKVAALSFGDFVKAVVDVQLGVIAVGGELHADGEAFLQKYFYPFAAAARRKSES